MPESEGEEEEGIERQQRGKHEPLEEKMKAVESEHQTFNGCVEGHKQQDEKESSNSPEVQSELEKNKPKLFCQICKTLFSVKQILYHSKKHKEDKSHPCPVCLESFDSRKELVPHMKPHMTNPANFYKKTKKKAAKQNEKKKCLQKRRVEEDNEDKIEPGEITIDPSLMLYYKSTHDPDVLHHIVQQSKSVHLKRVDDDEHVTYNYIDIHFKLQNRDEYPCPGTHCTRTFQHSKYLYVHLKSEHKGDENVKHFHEMRDKREKCAFCRRHYVSAYHHRKHQRAHFGDLPYTCLVVGCGARFSTTNELITHKQAHGYQLNYQCELKGCYVTFSDLGQVYHHEAQHFRDAAFTCTSPECKKYYLSKKEFIQHLSTHNITFSEDDFATQRKAKQKLLQTVTEETGDSKIKSEEMVNGDDLTASSMSCASSLNALSFKDTKGTVTSVAMCFDGSKFTCGFEKCGMTFSRARDVQRHLKCAHPEHLKLEGKEHRHDKERGVMYKGLKMKTESNNEEKELNELSTPVPPKRAGKERKESPRLKHNGSNSSSLAQNDALKEILIGFSKLDLNSTCSHNGPGEPSQSSSESNESQISLPQAIVVKSPVVVLQKKHLSEESVNVKSEQPSGTVEANSVESLATAKPYACKVKRCSFRTARRSSLSRHYIKRHNFTKRRAKRLTSYKPFICHLCSCSVSERGALRVHYIQVHKLSAAVVDEIKLEVVLHKTSKATEPAKSTSWPLMNNALKVKEREVSSLQQRYQRRKASMTRRENGRNVDNHALSKEVVEGEAEKREVDDKQQGESEDGTSQQGRTTKRLVAKGNLCYILAKFNKPFQCVVKDCDAAFSTQGGLVRHLQLVHHYNRSQLLLDKDSYMHQNPEVRKWPARKRPASHSDEPQPQYKCHFADCAASYHLKSSLVRHTRDYHSQPPEPIPCTHKGCTRMFNHASALKKHILYSHCELYDSLVLRLQSTHKKSISGCQNKLIVTSPSPPKEESDSPPTESLKLNPKSEIAAQSEEMDEEATKGKIKVESGTKEKNYFVYRSHEEALQMCQGHCFRMAYPCMVQGCDSVVKYSGSMQRHYKKLHRMRISDFVKNEDKLILNAEQLEGLIQRKSARPTITVACAYNGVRKMEYQAEPENPGGPSAPMSLHSIKAETLNEDNHDPLGFPEEVPPPVEQNSVLVAADDVLYGEPSTGGRNEEQAATTENSHNQEERVRWQNISLRPVTVNLSPPSSLCFTIEEGFQGVSSSKDGGKRVNRSAPLPNPSVRQPLKRKNELSEQPCNLGDQPRCPPPRSFDLATYKPMGFESSFLKFIQETSPKEVDKSSHKRRDSVRRGSVKENNQLGISHTHNRRSHSSLLKPLTMTGDFTSVQNLKSILDKALAGCGDLAIEQLQYLRPVVVLERPLCTTTLPNLFPSDNDSKLLLGS